MLNTHPEPVTLKRHRLHEPRDRRARRPDDRWEALHYYARIAPTLPAHLQGRAMTLKRYPDGVAGPHFYDKHCRGAPPWA